MHKPIQPKVTLVGAGPGDPDLLTIKGANALAEAQVVLYDALANEEILTYAPKKSIKIFVGKRYRVNMIRDHERMWLTLFAICIKFIFEKNHWNLQGRKNKIVRSSIIIYTSRQSSVRD